MIRPATPLTVMLFAAFVLLVLSVLSTPLIKAIPLGSFQGYTFGVFGFCRPDGSCSGFELGYDTCTASSPISPCVLFTDKCLQLPSLPPASRQRLTSRSRRAPRFPPF